MDEILKGRRDFKHTWAHRKIKDATKTKRLWPFRRKREFISCDIKWRYIGTHCGFDLKESLVALCIER